MDKRFSANDIISLSIYKLNAGSGERIEQLRFYEEGKTDETFSDIIRLVQNGSFRKKLFQKEACDDYMALGYIKTDKGIESFSIWGNSGILGRTLLSGLQLGPCCFYRII